MTINRSLVSTLAASACSLAMLGAGAARAADNSPVEQVSVKSVAHFGFDGTSISEAEQARILAQVATMKDVSWQTVRSTGYTDSVGPVDYNIGLAGRRADAVRAYLVGKGLDPGMIKTDARGPDDPVADNTTAAGRARNRRTEIEFVGVRSTTAKP